MLIPGVSRLRCLGLAGVCAVSVLAGLALVFRLVTVEGVSRLHTYELVGLLGLLVLPVATGFAYAADRRAAAGEKPDSADFATAPAPIIRAVRARTALTGHVEHEHGASDIPSRGGDRHRRRVDPPARREHDPARPAR